MKMNNDSFETSTTCSTEYATWVGYASRYENAILSEKQPHVNGPARDRTGSTPGRDRVAKTLTVMTCFCFCFCFLLQDAGEPESEWSWGLEEQGR